MSKAPGQYTPDEINHVFAQLQPHDVEQFYAVYQQWLRQSTIANLQAQIESLRNQIAENDLRIQQVQPSSTALSIIARLQSNGVTDPNLLDSMLDRGEAWLNSAMQHLDYCEQFDFIRGNYTEWCEHALEGAYDWIDSVQEFDVANNDKILTASMTGSTPTAISSPQPGEPLNEATEEIFLQKLMSEEDVSLLDTPQETSIISSTTQEVTPVTPTPLEDQDTTHMQATGPRAARSVSEHSIETHSPQEVPASSSVDVTDPTQVPLDEPSSMDSDSASISHTPVEETSAPVETISDTPAVDSPPDLDDIPGSTLIHSDPVPAAGQPEAALVEHAPSDTVGTAGTSATPHLPLEQAATTEPKEVEHEAVVSSDEVVVSPGTPALEEATAPSIPVVTPPKGISDASTIPVIPAAEAIPSKNTEPPARRPRKRNFLRRLFSIFSRRKPKK